MKSKGVLLIHALRRTDAGPEPNLYRLAHADTDIQSKNHANIWWRFTAFPHPLLKLPSVNYKHLLFPPVVIRNTSILRV